MSSYKFRGVLAPFHATRENDRITVENEYVRCVHDLRNGGEMTEAVILNGSGKTCSSNPNAPSWVSSKTAAITVTQAMHLQRKIFR